MKLVCKCGAANRLPSLPKSRLRCAKCKHEFTPLELAKAKPEQPKDFELDREKDIPFDPNEDEDWEDDEW